MMKLPLADCRIIANYPVFREALQPRPPLRTSSAKLNAAQQHWLLPSVGSNAAQPEIVMISTFFDPFCRSSMKKNIFFLFFLKYREIPECGSFLV